jgi:hypothetical protein
MRLYFSHSKLTYFSPHERIYVEWLKGAFPGCEIINPSDFDSHLLTDLFESADIIICADYNGFCGSGVATEVRNAVKVFTKPIFLICESNGKVHLELVTGIEYVERSVSDCKERYARIITAD